MNVVRASLLSLLSVCVALLGSGAAGAGPVGATKTFYHVGVIVKDAKGATEEITRALGYRFDPPQENSTVYGPWTIGVNMSIDGPPFLEVVRGNHGSPWDASRGPRLDHFGWHSDSMPVECDEAMSNGLMHLHDQRNYGKTYVSCRLISTALGAIIEIGTGGAPRDRPAMPYDHLGIVVSDLDFARNQLTKAIGVTWGPVQDLAFDHWKTKSVRSSQGPPYVELIQGGKDGLWEAVNSGPHLHHIGYRSSDVAAECARLVQNGLKPHFEPKSGKIDTGCYRTGPISGIVVEVSRK